MLTLSSYAVLICAFLTAIASTAVYVLSQAAEKAKDRAFNEYKLDSERKIALAHEGADRARADAERAKLETVKVSERLALTQERLDTANLITPFTDQQVDQIVKGILDVPLGDTQPMAVAANDAQAQTRLLQLTNAFMELNRRLYLHGTTGSFIKPADEKGEVVIHYWSDDRRAVAASITDVFRSAGVPAHMYKLSPKLDDEARYATRNMVLIGIAARSKPKFGGR